MIYNIIIGILMGIANLIPGVSGGTIALVGGIYDKLINSISAFTSFKFKKKVIFFLLEVFVGALAAIFIFSFLIKYSLDNNPSITYGIFSGLVIGSLPLMLRRIKKISLSNLILFIIGLSIIIGISFLEPQGTNITNELNHSFSSLIYDIFAGFIGAASMILPGLSGSFILLILNEYERVINSISSVDIIILAFFAVGVILGIVLMSKFLKILLKKFPTETFSFLFGLMLGSIPNLLSRTGQDNNILLIIFGIFIGIAVSVLFFYINYRRNIKTK